MAKAVTSQQEMIASILRGVDAVADSIRPTLGPLGRTVILPGENRFVGPRSTNDGATIAKCVEFAKPMEDMGAQLIKEVSLTVNKEAGDGTTTAAVLAQRLLHEGFRNVAAGADPLKLRRGMDMAAQVAARALQKIAIPANDPEMLSRVAVISCRDEVLGKMVAEAVSHTGRDGVVTVEETQKAETRLEIKDGMQFERGYTHPDFTTDEQKMQAKLEHPCILITDEKISQARQLLPLLDEITAQDRSLLIIAEEVSEDVMGLLLTNKKKGILKVCVVKPPMYGDGRQARMEDLAFYTGGVLVSERFGHLLEKTPLCLLGSAESVVVKRNSTQICGGAGGAKAIEERARYLRMMIEKAKYDFDRQRLSERLALLVSSSATIYVGGITELEMKDRKLRIDDALCAAKAAVAEGVVPGGGTALIDVIPAVRACVDTLDGDYRTGAKIIMDALLVPTAQIAQNAGFNGEMIAAQVAEKKRGIGFNTKTAQFEDMIKIGIIDPVRVTRLALLSAVSLSGVLLTTESCVIDMDPVREDPNKNYRRPQ